jgi:Dolichyl-phosphate-mannose-protein mannosyltransferase
MQPMSNSAKPDSTLFAEVRFAFLCGGIVLAAFLIVNPFAEMPFDDDWSYAFTVRQLLSTGHIIYNGWSAPVIITQAYWGAMFCKVFGFSFTALRFSTLPFAVGSVVLCYLLARRAGLRPRWAIFSALALGLNPLFLPLATSFMTDVPALFWILLSLYFLIVAMTKSRGGVAALAVAMGAGILGGMSRQVVWAVPLCVIPYVALVRCRDRVFVVCCIAGWLSVMVDAIATLHWFQLQSNVVIDVPIHDWLAAGFAHPVYPVAMGIFLYLTTVLLALPAGVLFFFAGIQRLRRDRPGFIGVVVVLLILVIIMNPGFAIEPWLNNLLTTNGILGGYELHGAQPISQPMSVRITLSAAAILVATLILILSLRWLVNRGTIKQRRRWLDPDPRRCALVAMGIFAAAYVILLVPRMFQTLIFDRYALPLIPLITIALLSFAQSALVKGSQWRWANPFAWGMLGIFACYALASTQDVLSLARARAAAAARLTAVGVPSTAITAGLEYDYWTQLNADGWINRPFIANPTHHFDPNLSPYPAIRAIYRLESNFDVDTEPSGFGSVQYISWLPPFHRQVLIDRFRQRQ